MKQYSMKWKMKLTVEIHKIMNKEEFKIWLIDAVSDSFMDLFYYDRKECEDMPLDELKKHIDNGDLNKEILTEVFLKQIDKEFKK